MPATLPRPQKPLSPKQITGAPAPETSCARVEIHAYLAARNFLLCEAEGNPNEATLRRAAAANDYAWLCLRSTRAPYQAQGLPEDEARGERQKCQAIELRLVELRASLSHRVA